MGSRLYSAVGWRRQYVDPTSVCDMSGSGAGDAAWTPSSVFEMPSSPSLETTQVSRKTHGRKHLRFRLGHRGRCTTKRSTPPVLPTPQSPKTTVAEIPPAAEPLALPHELPEAAEDAKEEPTGEQEEDGEMQGEPVDTREAPGPSSSSRGEKRTETHKRMMTKSPKRPATPVSLPDDPVKRRLQEENKLAEQ